MRDIRDEYCLKLIARQLDKMAADHDYMRAIGEDGRQKIYDLLVAYREIER